VAFRSNLRAPAAGKRNLSALASAFIVAGLIIAFLHIGREILLPLVIAALLGFILAPVIRRLRGLGLWNAPAVVITVALAIVALGGLGYIIALQVTQLAEDLPKYERNLRAKVRALSGSPMASGTIDRAAETLRDLQEEITKPSPPIPGTRVGPPAPKPILVEVKQPQPTGLEAIAVLVRPLLSPLATTALVILFLLFILLGRQDLRDRFLRLLGTGDLQRSTAALDDAASRLSRFFLMQTALNAGFGVVIAVGLGIIGVPNAVLWGILAGLMRFVPFVGVFIAAFFPVLLAAAVDPGWWMVLWTVALFVTTEPIAGQVVEPVLYGQHTGLSPVAIVIATLFWTILWGPIGLLLATPLTVCLVVLGKHVEALTFVDVLLGDEPALKPEERFYQRLLAGDATEAADQAEQALENQALSAYYDSIPMKALAMAQEDAAEGKLDREKQVELRDAIEEVVDDLSEYRDHPPAKPKKKGVADDADQQEIAEALVPVVSKDELEPEWQIPYPILCVASRRPLDEGASLMLADILNKHGLAAWVQPFADVASVKNFKVDTPDARLVCLSYFGEAANPTHMRYLIRRLKRLMPHARFLAGFWMLGDEPTKLEEWKAMVGAEFACVSLSEATAICVREAMGGEDTPSPRETASDKDQGGRVAALQDYRRPG
jgi:predicted PurR-regulated permease PerM